jgi:porphobilinogen synthase
VKPGLPYLDVIRAVRDEVHVPIVAYQVSGEYSMMHAAAERGWLDLDRAMVETTTALHRAGADIVISYFARAIAARLGRGPTA